MLNRLQKKWKVSGLRLIVILLVFAIGGSLTGYVARKIVDLFVVEAYWLWIIIYIVVICLLWPLAVLLVSIPFGQFRFFMRYVRKIGARIGVVNSKSVSIDQTPVRIAILASGAG